MKTGRPPSWNPVSQLNNEVWTDVLTLASKARVTFPPAVRQRLPWLHGGATSLLAVSEPGRRAELLPWDPAGKNMIEELRSVIEEAEDSERDDLTLAAMDRFSRLSLDATGRTILPAPLASHLDTEIDRMVRVVVRGPRLWLWSERRWEAGRAGRIASLAKAQKGPMKSNIP